MLLTLVLAAGPQLDGLSPGASSHPALPLPVAVEPRSTPPPPLAPRVAGLPAPRPFDNTNHYYEGAVYSGAVASATSMSVDLSTPEDLPDASNFYYVILSVWDSAKSYDQIGMAADNGAWGLAYSWTNACAGTYNYSPDEIPLLPGTTYEFSMTVGGGNVLFAAYNASTGSKLWTLNAPTGGDTFDLDSSYAACSGDYDYTVYEESYDDTQNVPTYDFFFTNNLEDGTSESSWTSFSAGTPPTGVVNAVSGSAVTIENEPFSLVWSPSTSPLIAEQGSLAFTNLSALMLGTGETLTFATVALPTGWTGKFTPASGADPLTSELALTLPTGVALGTDSVQATATDGAGLYTRITLTVQVIAHVAAAGPTASPASIDLGGRTTFSATASGGSGGYTYAWSGLPAGCSGTTSSVPCRPTGAGTFTIGVVVTDSAGYSASAGPLSFTVDPLPTVSLPVAHPASVDVDQPVTFSASGGAGTGTYASYAWTATPSSGMGCANPTGGGASSSNACTPTVAGTYAISVAVTDSNGNVSAVQTLSGFVVLPALVVPAPTVNRSSSDVGQALLFTVAPTGGSGTYTSYVWTASSSSLGCASSSSTTITCTPTVAGSGYTLQVTVTDSNHGTATGTSAAFTVDPDPTVAAPVSTPSTGEVGISLALSATVSGGSGSISSYTWAGTSGLGCTGSSASLTCLPTTASTYTVTVTVRDSNGVSAESSPLALTVVSPLTLTASDTGGYGTVDLSVQFASDVTGGAAPVAYAWHFGDGGTASGASAAHRYTTAGTYTVWLFANDSAGGHATAQVDVMALAPIVAQLQAAPASIQVGDTSTLTVSATGGAPDYTFTWVVLPAGCTSANSSALVCKPTSPGTFPVEVQVGASDSGTVWAWTNLTVTAAPSSGSSGLTGFLGGNDLTLLVLAIVVVAVAALAAVALLRRKKGGAGPGAAPAVPPGAHEYYEGPPAGGYGPGPG